MIEEERLGVYGTFRGCLSDDWISPSPGPMERQRNGAFSQALKKRGLRFIVVGDLKEEWYLYSIAHPIRGPHEIVPNLERYFSPALVEKLLRGYPELPADALGDEAQRSFGEILSDVQVHLPIRLLARDLLAHDFPVLCYSIRWTPAQARPYGYVTHGTDRALWALRVPILSEEQQAIAKAWLDAIDEESLRLNEGGNGRSADDILVLKEDRVIIEKDEEFGKYERLAESLTSVL